MREALRSLLTSTSSRHRPRQVAAAIALGVCVGLIPLSSPLFYVLLACIFLLPVHFAAFLLATGLVSFFSISLQPALGQIGMRSLSHPYLMEMWLQMDAYPLIPWLGLHNTVVNGGFVVGLSLIMPVYLFARPLAVWICGVECLDVGGFEQLEQDQELFFETSSDYFVVEPVQELAEAPVRIREPEPAPESQQLQRVNPTASEIAFSELSQLLNTDGQHTLEVADTQAVIERAAKVAALVDEMLSLLELDSFLAEPHSETSDMEPVAERGPENLVETEQRSAETTNRSRDNSWRLDTPSLTKSTRTPASAVVPALGGTAQSTSEDLSQLADRPVRTKLFQADGTVIEVFRKPRYRSSTPADRVSTFSTKTLAEVEMVEVPRTSARHSASANNIDSSEQPHPVAINAEAGHAPVSEQQSSDNHHSDIQARRDEALRYLLHHLHEQKEKV
ncbi:MAG: TIGR03546 family protein [Pirellulaceae bacterium]